MKLEKGCINSIQFYHRPNTSDLKTFEEVIGKDVYQKRNNKINKGEFWYDCGGNVGAFALLAKSKGAMVEIFEPDPFNCEMIEKNLKLNGMSAKVNQVALVHNDKKKAKLFVGKNGNYWRNSLVKNWDKKGILVDCKNFDSALKENNACVKMDIEGMEMPIIETTNRTFKKLIFEWSFDIDPSIPRYLNIIEKLEKQYDIKTSKFNFEGRTVWPQSWFPACVNVFCYAKN